MSNEKVVLRHRIPVIMPLFNALEYTKQAVDTLKKNTHANMYEVIFVDNGSTDGTKDYLKQLVQDDPEHFRVITNETNLGFAGGMNTGLRAISTFDWEYVVLVNNDLLFSQNWLYQLLQCMQFSGYKNLGAVGPVSNAAGGTQGVQVGYKTIGEFDKYAQDWHQAHANQWAPAARLVGLCLLMSREYVNAVGEFDERFIGGMWEDNDLALRGYLKGFRSAVDQSTLLHHYMNKTFQTNNMDASGLFHSNRQRYVDKWAAIDSPFEDMAVANANARIRLTGKETAKLSDGRTKKFVVAACRVKDGARYLPRVLERISTFADEIVVSVSKLTTDNTKEICGQFPKVVLVGDDVDDVKGYAEADSRNLVLDMAYSRHPDWIWLFDHDEMPATTINTEIERLTNPENPETMLWTFPIIQLWNDDNTRRVDGLWGKFWQGRMFRALPGLRIEGTGSLIHVGSHPSFAAEHWGTSLVKILHYGNVDPAERAKKYERYTKIDTEKNLDMVLGQWKDYYWKLYYGDPAPAAEVTEFKSRGGVWRTMADPLDWSRPPYGSFFARDAYRHVNDERAAKFVPFDEDHRISLCMLIHNEGEMVARCLEGARDYVDEIICVDTGCTDNTPNFARQIGARVYPFKWTDNFSEARNFSLSLATGDWILRLDPDEQLPPESLPHLPKMIREASVEGWIFPIVNWLEHPGQTQNAQWALSETCRLFKNNYPKVRYAGIVHEELDDSFIEMRKEREAAFLASGGTKEEAEKATFLDIRRAPCQLWHFGYLRGQTVLDNKFKYYYGLGNKQIEERPDDPRAWFTTGVHALHVGDYEEAINRYKKALELNPKDHMAMNDIGVLLWTCGRLDQAEKYFKLAMESMGKDVHENHKQRVEKNLQTVRRTILSMMLFR